MKQLEKNPQSEVKIRFPDCDPFNHLNNSKYIDYFLNAREDHLSSFYQFDIAKLAKEKGLAWFVTLNQIAYFSPASTMETVVIQTRLVSHSQKELLLEASMWNSEKTILKSVLWTKFMHFNLATRRTEIHSEEMTNLFKQIVNPIGEGLTFEDRAAQVKQTKKP